MSRTLRIFFDVDYTILGQDGSLRPGVKPLFERLVAEQHEVYVWSGFGERSEDVRALDLDHLVSAYFRKPLTGLYLGHEDWGLPFRPDFVIDDHPGPPAYLGGVCVTAYVDRRSGEDDGEMGRVYEAILARLER